MSKNLINAVQGIGKSHLQYTDSTLRELYRQTSQSRFLTLADELINAHGGIGEATPKVTNWHGLSLEIAVQNSGNKRVPEFLSLEPEKLPDAAIIEEQIVDWITTALKFDEKGPMEWLKRIAISTDTTFATYWLSLYTAVIKTLAAQRLENEIKVNEAEIQRLQGVQAELAAETAKLKAS